MAIIRELLANKGISGWTGSGQLSGNNKGTAGQQSNITVHWVRTVVTIIRELLANKAISRSTGSDYLKNYFKIYRERPDYSDVISGL